MKPLTFKKEQIMKNCILKIIIILLFIHEQIIFSAITPSKITDVRVLHQKAAECVFHTLWNLKTIYVQAHPNSIRNPSLNQTEYDAFLTSLQKNRQDWGVFEPADTGGTQTLFHYIVANNLENNTYVDLNKLKINEEDYNKQISFLYAKFFPTKTYIPVFPKIAQNYNDGNWTFWSIETPYNNNMAHSILVATKKIDDKQVEIKIFDSRDQDHTLFINQKFIPFLNQFLTTVTPPPVKIKIFQFADNQLKNLDQFVAACGDRKIRNEQINQDIEIPVDVFTAGLDKLLSNVGSNTSKKSLWAYFKTFLGAENNSFHDALMVDQKIAILEKFIKIIENTKSVEALPVELKKEIIIETMSLITDDIDKDLERCIRNANQAPGFNVDLLCIKDTELETIKTLLSQLNHFFDKNFPADYSGPLREQLSLKINSLFKKIASAFIKKDNGTYFNDQTKKLFKTIFNDLVRNVSTICTNFLDTLDALDKTTLSTHFFITITTKTPSPTHELSQQLTKLQQAMAQLKKNLEIFSLKLTELKANLKKIKP